MIISVKKRLEANFYEITDPIPKRLADTLQHSVWFVNRNAGQKLIEFEMKNKRIYAVVVTESEDKTIFIAKERDDNWRIVNSSGDITGDFVVKSEDIVYEGQTVGRADVFLQPGL